MKTAILSSGLFIVAAAVLTAGCDNRHLIGAVDGGGGTAGTGQPSGDSGAPDIPDTGSTPDVGGLGPVQSWTGYVENFKFPSGSDVIKFSFASNDAGQLVGWVTLGNGTPPPPATDPNVGYPPGVGIYPPLIGAPTYVAEGYAYTMRDGMMSGRRLQFSVGIWELWTGWCALQTPVPSTTGVSLCLPNLANMISADHMHCALYNPTTGQTDIPVDCGKLELCILQMVCLCDVAASTCAVQDRGNLYSFDVSINNDLADGSATGLGNVHFTKDP